MAREQREAHAPRQRRLTKIKERRITALLASMPPIEPEIEIRPLEGQQFEVCWREPPDDFVLPLEVGACGFYADYDAPGGEFEEATLLRVTRRVKAGGVRCLEVYEWGGAPIDGVFRICWGGRGFYLIARGQVAEFNPNPIPEFNPRVSPFPPYLAAAPDASVSETAPLEQPIPTGYHTVACGGRAHECVQVLTLRRDLLDNGGPPDSLDEQYVSREGRTVLLRRCRSAEYYRAFWSMRPKQRGTWQDEVPRDTQIIVCGGTEFHRAFDILTDASLGPLLKPPFDPSRVRL